MITDKTHNKPLKFVPAIKIMASTGLANARRLAGRYGAFLDSQYPGFRE